VTSILKGHGKHKPLLQPTLFSGCGQSGPLRPSLPFLRVLFLRGTPHPALLAWSPSTSLPQDAFLDKARPPLYYFTPHNQWSFLGTLWTLAISSSLSVQCLPPPRG
jgi:hypothetical protein